MPEALHEDTQSKRDALLAAARELFASQGYEKTTIAEIAHNAGVAVGTVYLYFHNKHEIYVCTSLAWIDKMAGVLQDPAIVSLPFTQIPRAIVEGTFRICREGLKFMSLFEVDVQSKEEQQQHHQAKQKIASNLAAFLRQITARGELAPFDTEMYASILFELVNGVLYDCFEIERGEREALYRETTIDIIERLFFGPPLIEGAGGTASDAQDQANSTD